MTRKEAVTIFGISSNELVSLSAKQLSRLYQMKAHELHPDKEGGDHDKFIELTNAYNELL